jgi:hypothetical protein
MKDIETPVTDFNPLALDNQLCFALYVCSKEIIRKYTPLLEPLGITYTCYITLLCLWEKDNVPFTEDGDLTANGIAYQIKFEKATFTNEKTLARL